MNLFLSYSLAVFFGNKLFDSFILFPNAFNNGEAPTAIIISISPTIASVVPFEVCRLNRYLAVSHTLSASKAITNAHSRGYQLFAIFITRAYSGVPSL